MRINKQQIIQNTKEKENKSVSGEKSEIIKQLRDQRSWFVMKEKRE